MPDFPALAELAERLEGNAQERGDLRERQHDLFESDGQLMLEARETEGITITAAAELIGLSRPEAYRRLEAAERGRLRRVTAGP